MKAALEAADAWLDGLSTAWNRVMVFWLVIAGSGFLGGLFGEYPGLVPILQFGGFTFLFLGPVFIWATMIAAVVWIRFVHMETASAASFLLLGSLVAINGATCNRDLSIAAFVGINVVTIGLIAFRVARWRSARVAETSNGANRRKR